MHHPSVALALVAACTVAAAQQSPGSIEVVGRREGGAYQASEVSGAKSSLPLRELPQSVRTLSRQAIDDLGAVRLDDVLDYVGGVSRQNSFGGLWDNIAIRGLPGNENTGMSMLRNGFSANRGFNAPRDVASIERIEFLKGPNAALYGNSEPGGTVNLVTKKPLWRFANAADVFGGSFASYRVAVDTTGPLDIDRLAYRLNVALERRNSFRDAIDSRREVVAPALTWRITNTTTLDYDGEVLHQRVPLDRGVVAVDNRLGAVSRRRFLGEPGDGDIQQKNQTHQFVLTQELNADWQLRLGAQYRETGLDGYSSEAQRLNPVNTGRSLWRQRRYRDYGSFDTEVTAELGGTLLAAGMQHELLLGTEFYRFKLDQRVLRINPTAAAPYAIDIFEPVYGQALPNPRPFTDTSEWQRSAALIVQDTVVLAPQWRLVAGLRHDRYDQKLVNNLAGGARSDQDVHETTPRVGVTWLFAPRWSAYASAGRSFRPNPGSDAQGRAFDPETGRAVEVGAKWERADQRIGANAALFHITKRNALTTPPNSAFQIATGEVRSRGAEADIAGQLTERWRLSSSLTLTDVEITRDEMLAVGGRLLGVPKVNASVLAVYENLLTNGARWGAGAGLTYVGKRLGQARTQAEANVGTPAFDLPSYTTAKLVAYWRISQALRVSLDIDNVLDRTYYTNAYSRVWVSPGSPRSVTLGAQLRF